MIAVEKTKEAMWLSRKTVSNCLTFGLGTATADIESDLVVCQSRSGWHIDAQGACYCVASNVESTGKDPAV